MPGKTPTLHESAGRNAKVDPKRVAAFVKTVQTLQDRGVLQKTEYGITPPFGRAGRQSIERPIRSMNQQQAAS